MKKVFKVDLPNSNESPEGDTFYTWVNVESFLAKSTAIEWIRKHIDPYCDDEGRIRLITESRSEK